MYKAHHPRMLACYHIILVLLTCSVYTSTSKRTGCAAPNVLPNKPFFVVWNHPSKSCENRGIDLGFNKWGIVDNPGDNFIGEKITIFYRLGHWPQIGKQAEWNGGIPQLGNLTFHLNKVQSDIKHLIPNASFDGLSVIDFEAWRPLYATNYDSLSIYQTKSKQLVQKRFPNYNKTQIVREATREFELGARSFEGKTLQLATYLRPGGRWGYYGYPRCWDSNCNSTTIKYNDKLSWIFNTSTGLYPSIYFSASSSASSRSNMIKKKVHETLRVKAKWGPQDAVILPYAQNQNGPYKFFQDDALLNAIRQPADMGAAGVVLWGSSAAMRPKNECSLLQDYINSTLGPYSLAVSNFFGNCSQQLCQGHGRCVRKDYEAFYQYHLRASGRKDCLIPEELLQRKSRKRRSASERSGKVSKSATENAALKFESEKTSSAFFGKVSPFGDILKRFKWDFNDDNVEEGQMNASGALKHDDHQSQQVSDEFDNFDQGQGNDDFAFDDENPLNFPPMKYSDDPNKSPMYDFDDYVCKCFAGWTGIHCDKKDEE